MVSKKDPIIVLSDDVAVAEQHQKYYFDFVVFEIEKTLFRVPKNNFLWSNPKFFDQFDLPVTPSDEDKPALIGLKDVTVREFEGFLLVLYKLDGTATTYEEWLGALELATRWKFPDIRTKAINTLSNLNKSGSRTTIEIIQLAKKYGIKTWLQESYVTLVQQKNLSEMNLDGLSFETRTLLLSAQTRFLQTFPGQVGVALRWFGPALSMDDRRWVEAEVDSVFSAELSALE